MKEARLLYKKTGTALFLFLTLFSLVRDFVIVPVMGKIWSLALKTTPDGFLIFSNLGKTLLKSPWIVLVALFLIAVWVVLSVWQLTTCILGAGYATQGRKPVIRDLIRVSFVQAKEAIRGKNLLLPLYVLILLPFANVIYADDLIGYFMIPEFIGDFVALRPVLLVLMLLAAIGLVYLMLRWFYVLPSFVLGSGDFRTARLESLRLTEKNWLKSGIRIFFYYITEVVRIGIVPALIILVPCLVCYISTSEMQFAYGLFNTIGMTYGVEIVNSITGSFVTVSIMCYLASEYRKRKEENGEDAEFVLPELPTGRQRKSMSIFKVTVLTSLVFSVLTAGVYMGLVYGAQIDSSLIEDVFAPTQIIAHKGYSSKAPENTMPAFRMADECEVVDMIELDVWTTKDGIPVVLHNRSIEEATGVKKNIDDCTYDELKQYPALYQKAAKDFPGTTIPSLEEVIAAYAFSTPLLIEIKGFDEDPDLPAKIVELMHKYGCTDTSMIHSGNYGALKAVKEIDPEISCGLILMAAAGSYYTMPYVDFFSLEHTLLTAGTVNSLHRHGKKVYAWTVNYPENADRLRFSDVDGLITDVPEEINDYVSDTNSLLKEAWEVQIRNRLEDLSGYMPDMIEESDV